MHCILSLGTSSYQRIQHSIGLEQCLNKQTHTYTWIRNLFLFHSTSLLFSSFTVAMIAMRTNILKRIKIISSYFTVYCTALHCTYTQHILSIAIALHCTVLLSFMCNVSIKLRGIWMCVLFHVKCHKSFPLCSTSTHRLCLLCNPCARSLTHSPIHVVFRLYPNWNFSKRNRSFDFHLCVEKDNTQNAQRII